MAKTQPETVIAQIFRQYHAELLAEVERADTLLAVKRIYDAGKSLEIAIVRIFNRLLPDWVGITRGKVISSDCKDESKEIDIIFYDKRYFSGLVVSEVGPDVFSYICIDTVLGVLAIKKTLAKPELKDSIDNLTSITDLRREPLKNRTHFDIPLIGMTHRGGVELNRIFTGIVGYSNSFLFKRGDKKCARKNDTEVQATFDAICAEDWFDGAPLDLILTVDGSIFFPLSLGEKGWKRTVEIEKLMLPKTSIRPYVDGDEVKADSNLVLGYNYSLDEPHLALGQFIMYLQYYCSQLVKASPNFELFFSQFLDPNIQDMMTQRNLDDIKNSI